MLLIKIYTYRSSSNSSSSAGQQGGVLRYADKAAMIAAGRTHYRKQNRTNGECRRQPFGERLKPGTGYRC